MFFSTICLVLPPSSKFPPKFFYVFLISIRFPLQNFSFFFPSLERQRVIYGMSKSPWGNLKRIHSSSSSLKCMATFPCIFYNSACLNMELLSHVKYLAYFAM